MTPKEKNKTTREDKKRKERFIMKAGDIKIQKRKT